MSDPQDRAEALDDDRIGQEYPPEDPVGVDEYGITPAEERYDEPLEERIEREEPDPLLDELEGRRPAPPSTDDRRVEVQPITTEAESIRDDEKDLVADAVEPVEHGTDPIGEVPDRDASTQDRTPPPAEEAALRVEEP